MWCEFRGQTLNSVVQEFGVCPRNSTLQLTPHYSKSILCGGHVFHLHVGSLGRAAPGISLLSRSVSKISSLAEGPVWPADPAAIAQFHLGACSFRWRSKGR